MENNIIFEVKYKDKTYTFDFGSEVYIFHTGIYNDMDKKYGIKALSDYVALIHNCYMSDSIKTPLGELADYVAVNWKKVKNLGKYDLLDQFYETIF